MNQQATSPAEQAGDAADRFRRLRETTVSILVQGEPPPPAASERLAVVSHRIDPPHGPLPAMNLAPGGARRSVAAAAEGPSQAKPRPTFRELSAALGAETRAIRIAGLPQPPLPSAAAAARSRGPRPLRGRLPVSQRVRALCQSLLACLERTETDAGLALAVVRPSEALAETGLLVELAMALAEDEERSVLLLDADFWTFELSRHFRAVNEPGLAEALLQRDGEPLPVVPTSAAGLSLLPCGQATAGVDGSAWRRLLAACCESFDCVLIDAGKADAPQALPALRASHGAFLLFGLEELPRRAVLETLAQLQLREAPLKGCIVTGAPEPA